MTVYVVNQPARRTTGVVYDISPATAHGPLDFIFTMHQPRPSSDPAWALNAAHEKLKDFDCQNDFILWAGGDPFSLAVVTAVLAEGFETFSFLKWERDRETHEGHYVPITLDLEPEAITNGH